MGVCFILPSGKYYQLLTSDSGCEDLMCLEMETGKKHLKREGTMTGHVYFSESSRCNYNDLNCIIEKARNV